jgi:hypothetical protein
VKVRVEDNEDDGKEKVPKLKNNEPSEWVENLRLFSCKVTV